MGFSSLATIDIPGDDRWNPRGGTRVNGFIIHHNAGVDAWRTARQSSRGTSANYWISNDGTIISQVDEDHRAWTSGMVGYPAGAAADYRSITVEVSNSPEGAANGTWAISTAAQDALERLIGDVFRRHQLGPVKRGPADGGGVHVHQDYVPTACPGPYIMGRLSTIIANAERHRVGGTSSSKETEVISYHREDATARKTGRELKPGAYAYLHTTAGAPTSKASNIVGGIGQYALTAHIYAEAEPGEAVDLVMLWDDTTTSGPHSSHYTERVVADEHGVIRRSVTFQRVVQKGYAVYLRAKAADSNTKPVKITLLDSDAMLFKA